MQEYQVVEYNSHLSRVSLVLLRSGVPSGFAIITDEKQRNEIGRLIEKKQTPVVTVRVGDNEEKIVVRVRILDRDIENEYLIPGEEGVLHKEWKRNVFACFCCHLGTEALYLTKKRLIKKLQLFFCGCPISWTQDVALEDVKRTSLVTFPLSFWNIFNIMMWLNLVSLSLVLVILPSTGARVIGIILLVVAIVIFILGFLFLTKMMTVRFIAKEPDDYLQVTLERDDAEDAREFVYYTIGQRFERMPFPKLDNNALHSLEPGPLAKVPTKAEWMKWAHGAFILQPKQKIHQVGNLVWAICKSGANLVWGVCKSGANLVWGVCKSGAIYLKNRIRRHSHSYESI